MTRYHRHLHSKKRRVLIVAKKVRPKLVDRLTFVVAVLEPLVTVPQAVVIFQHRSAADVSLATWIGYETLTLVWLWYGIVHKERIILLYQGLFFVVQSAVIIGGIVYGAHW
ncbi:MAG TPA: hypothetical protein VHC98_02505 [Candidatus Saccharimonadales bacterium]|nr:hypothetical protein [Candidatus Saccharimonadales bacterium]